MDDKMKNLENRIKKEMDLEFRRGMYMAAHGISGVINQMIEKLENKPKKRLVDYQKTLSDISRLCRTKLNNPDQKQKETEE